MARRKKAQDTAAAPPSAPEPTNGQLPLVPEGQAAPAAAAPASAQPAPTPPPATAPKAPPSPPPSDEEVRAAAVKWAVECCLKPPFDLSGPTRTEWGGYVVTIRERKGEHRLATARFKADGSPSMWTIDGMTGV